MPRDNDCRWCAMPLEPGRSRGYCDACRASLEPAPKPARSEPEDRRAEPA